MKFILILLLATHYDSLSQPDFINGYKTNVTVIGGIEYGDKDACEWAGRVIVANRVNMKFLCTAYATER